MKTLLEIVLIAHFVHYGCVSVFLDEMTILGRLLHIAVAAIDLLCFLWLAGLMS